MRGNNIIRVKVSAHKMWLFIKQLKKLRKRNKKLINRRNRVAAEMQDYIDKHKNIDDVIDISVVNYWLALLKGTNKNDK